MVVTCDPVGALPMPLQTGHLAFCMFNGGNQFILLYRGQMFKGQKKHKREIKTMKRIVRGNNLYTNLVNQITKCKRIRKEIKIKTMRNL